MMPSWRIPTPLDGKRGSAVAHDNVAWSRRITIPDATAPLRRRRFRNVAFIVAQELSMSSKQVLQEPGRASQGAARPSGSGAEKYAEHGRSTNINLLAEVFRNVLPADLVLRENSVVVQQRLFRAGECIHLVGQPFDIVYVVYAGSVRVSACDALGNEQVLSFPMRGDLFGFDGIDSGDYVSQAIALTACNLILLPFRQFGEIFQAQPEFEQAILRAMSHELVRRQAMIGAMGTLGAEARVARFLMFNSERFGQLGWSEKSFTLSMTRRDIGSYLGLSLETVSRILSTFDDAGLIRVENRTITLLNAPLLTSMRRVGSRKQRGGASQPTRTGRELDVAVPPVSVAAEHAAQGVARTDHPD